MKKVLIFPTLLLITICSYSQSFWKIENEYGDQILLSVVLDEEKKTFEAYTRKDALKDIAGNLTYTLAKSTGKLKYAEIVYIKGQTHGRPDSLHLTGDFFYFDKHFGFKALLSDGHFRGKYIDNKNKSHLLNGYKVQNSQPIKDYPSIINKAI